MNSKRTKTRILIAVVAILCILLSTLLYSIYSIQQMFDNLQLQVNTRTVIITLKDNLTILLNAETGERGYAITGDSNYLEPYKLAGKQLAVNKAMLAKMLKNELHNKAELDSLQMYIDKKMAYIAGIVNLKATGNEKKVTELLTTGEGKRLMDKVREHNQTLQADAENLFNERRIITDDSIERTRVVFLIDGIFSLAIVLFLAFIIIRELNLRAKNERRLKEYTAELQRKNEEIEQFAFVASHDLQQPLRSISNFTGLLEQKNAETMDEEAMQYMSFIKGGAARMTSLIADLLEYSRVGKDTKKVTIDCNAVINEILTDMSAAITETGAKIHISKLPVMTGYVYIKSVFRNLLTNAVKFAKKNDPPVIYVTAKDLGKEFQFTIKDNGIGIENTYKERIFIIFQRLHTRKDYPGTGIGLSISKKIVELHGGKIWVDSEPGKGSSFHFTISKHVS